jgi:uncharacterized protein VirK/YbjX
MKYFLLIQYPVLVGTLVWATGWSILKTGNLPICCPSLRRRAPRSGAITLRSGLAGTRAGLSYVREFLKLTVRSCINYRSTRQWVPYWNSTPLLTEIARSRPGVLKKIYRPYMTNRLRCNDRLDILTSHYALITQLGLGALVLRAADSPVMLSQFTGKSGSAYQIQLEAVGALEREGELVLQMVSEGTILYSVAFTLFAHAGLLSVAIGCLQGWRAADTLDRIRHATRDLFGLRPKTLLVRLVQQIGHQFGCRDLLLVSNQNRVVSRQIRKGSVFADYDATWEELGAERRPDGDFKLPCVLLEGPDFQAIASNKRSEAKKRFALLTAVSQLTCEGLERPLAA